MKTKSNLSALEDNLHYHFRDPLLLQTALTHRSFLNESSLKQSNERLEFLGDAVLELIVSQYLYQQRPNEPEGLLTAARSAIVRTETLAQLASNLQLGTFLKLSRGEERGGGRTNTSLLANLTEAIIGAIYLDSGLDSAQDFVSRHLFPLAQNLLKGELKDAKSSLQEKVQDQGYPSPTYTTISEEGPDHDKVFTVAVSVNGTRLATGQGKNKQNAQQAAAKAALGLYAKKLIKK